MNSFLLNHWKFHYKDVPEAWFKGFQDDNWEEVTVPHDWSVHMPFSKEYSSGTGYLAGGTGWYRSSFLLPEELRGKRIFITFDGIYKNSQIWCNSYYLGKRPYGYSTFCYDITEQACFGSSPNLIAVRVDHPDIADSRWFTGSGLTRKVTITVEEQIHPQFQGIFFKTPSVTSEKAEIEIDNTIVNELSEEVTVTVTSLLTLHEQEVLHIANTDVIPAGGKAIIPTKGTLEHPKLWSPELPQLYQLTTVTSAKTSGGSLVTSMESKQTVGIRSIHFDPNNGFFLNNINYKLKGVCVHHDAGCLGAAVLPEVWMRRLCTLKDMGCNAIRMSHNPHMPELYDLCDSLGFFVMDEAFDEWEGAKNKWSIGHNVYPPKHQGYFEDFHEWHEKDLSDLIKRDRNHPSIIAWSIGNEIDYPNDPYCHPLFEHMTGNNDNNKPMAERMYRSDRPNAERLAVLADKLIAIVKQHDTTRPVTAAVAFPELSSKVGYFDHFDIVGYNYKEQFYQEDHLRYPDKPFLGSENSHSYEAWKAVRENDYISGQFLWTGIDYLGEAHGWPIHGSGAGILTLAGYPKTSCYRRKSFWSEIPMLYLVTARAEADNSHREWKPMYRSWNYLKGEPVEVRCYTNLPCVKLLCNEKDHGMKLFDDQLGYISWTIPYEPGELSAIGYLSLSDEQNCIQDSITDTGASCNIELKLWHPSEKMEELCSALEAYSCPETFDHTRPCMKQIEVTITDNKGRRVTNDSTMLQVNVTGSGKLAGLENGDLSDCTEYNTTYRRAFEGRLLVYILDETVSGQTTVTVQGAGLKKATIIC
ncbi:MAG TPA: glycoside hydrolase family 2 TIM barrel-domain containing protein [Mobilitalea sp.]|nr:glycoside hydrolase family 2 TIM barrel-domain containing protein [Mobilitalea sp.]